MKLLIAYDGSECAESVLDDLTHAGLPAKGEALVMSVAEVWLPPPPPSAQEIVQLAVEVRGPLGLERKYMAASKSVVEADKTAARAAARFQANFPEWKVKHESSWGSPNVELFSKAEEWKADLIVAGSHGRSALGRIFLGSISQWLLNEAKCSVRIARGHVDEPDFPVRVIVGVDGSSNANAAVNEIVKRNWPARSEFRAVAVNQPLEPTAIGKLVPPIKQSVEECNTEDKRYTLRLARAAAKRLTVGGLRAEAVAIDGEPKRGLVQLAEEWRADCIFLGATGLSNRVERFLLGSVAGAVAARAHCSVEIVRTRKRKRTTNRNGNGN
jgi:nucleotide-binding universal stress UspA family protein